MSGAIVEVNGVSKNFGNKMIFKDFYCRVETGGFVVLVGSSGSGKTTLLNMIGGLEPVSDGGIVVAGLDLANAKSLRNYYRNVVGFIFQNFALVEQKTVLENLKMVHTKGQTGIAVEDALKSVGMAGMQKQKVYTLSGGEQQRIALARLRLKQCALILADEPTGSLDRKNGDIVMGLLHELNDEGKTVIMVTHDESLIRESDRVISLS